MPRLIHLNGPPGIGKSTLARRYVDRHPLSFCLEIDGFRSLIGAWRDHPEESGALARRMALEMARQHLTAGYDVIVPQFVARSEFAYELKAAAAEAGATFVEVVLFDSPEAARARFLARADDPRWAEHHREAVLAMASAGGYPAMYEALTGVVDALPDPIKVPTLAGEVEAAYQSLLRALGDDDPCIRPT